MSFSKRHAFVTGSSRGIGRGVALKLAEQGVDIAVHYFRNEAAAKDTLAEVRKLGADGFVLQGHIGKTDEITRMFATVRERFGKFDIFVANARTEAPEFFHSPLDITLEQWDAAFASQSRAFLQSAREASAIMPDGGRILALTYAQGSRTGGVQPWVAMGSAKAAVESLVRYLAVTFAQRGITVNAISPGWTEDSVLNSLPSAAQELIRNWHQRGWTPMRRLGTPADIGNVVALFCSEQAGWITGQVIYADGGASLMNPEAPTEIQIG